MCVCVFMRKYVMLAYLTFVTNLLYHTFSLSLSVSLSPSLLPSPLPPSFLPSLFSPSLPPSLPPPLLYYRGLKEGEERINSGKDFPTFIPRTYLWSKRETSPHKLQTSKSDEKPEKPDREGGGGGGGVGSVIEDWKQLQVSQHQSLLVTDTNVVLKTQESEKILNSRYTQFLNDE